MTAAKKKIDRLEAAQGVGRTAWEEMAAQGQRCALKAAAAHGGDAGQVRRVFADFRRAYRPGMGAAQMNKAADAALDALWEVLPYNAYVMTLALLMEEAGAL